MGRLIMKGGGYFKEIRKTYKDDMLILPVRRKSPVYNDYSNLAVVNKEIIPNEVYFDGAEEGIDCPCCGDRWSRLNEWDTKEKIYIYENLDEFEKSKLKRFRYYVILSELKKADTGNID
nr:MAG TPA: SARCOSINE OXIDASE ALPHA SUBUNIT, SARCOSINE Oxidase, Ligand Complex, Oxidoreductase [Caudoviricetes sp.]